MEGQGSSFVSQHTMLRSSLRVRVCERASECSLSQDSCPFSLPESSLLRFFSWCASCVAGRPSCSICVSNQSVCGLYQYRAEITLQKMHNFSTNRDRIGRSRQHSTEPWNNQPLFFSFFLFSSSFAGVAWVASLSPIPSPCLSER